MGANVWRSRMRAKAHQENTCAHSTSADAGAGLLKPRKIHKNGSVLRPWTAEEDAVLREHLVCQIGTRVGAIKPDWLFIQRHMPWRSVDQMRARWRRIEHYYLPDKQRMGGPAKGSVCRRCGVPRAGHTCPFHKPRLIGQAAGRSEHAAPNVPIVAVAEAALMPALHSLVVWKPSLPEEIGDIGTFPWEATASALEALEMRKAASHEDTGSVGDLPWLVAELGELEELEELGELG